MKVRSRTIKNASFRGANWERFDSHASHFWDCDFGNARILDACWGLGGTLSTYTNCVFDGAIFDSIAPGCARFDRCSFRDTRIKQFFAFEVDLIDCYFSGELEKGFINAKGNRKRLFRGVRRNVVHGNDFTTASLLDFSFRSGVDLSLQKLPSGPGYVLIRDTRAALAALTKHAEHYAPLADPQEVKALSMLLQFDVDAGQQQQLYRPRALKLSTLPDGFWHALAANDA